MKIENIYCFSLTLNDGKELKLEELKDKVVLFVNTALHSPFTDTFYPFLEDLYLRYQSFGFEVIDIPSNQFKEQNPESDQEIDEICKKDYRTTFLRTIKSDVIGENCLPLYQYFTSKKKFLGFDKGNLLSPVLAMREIKKNPLWMKDNAVKENFTFFFVDRKGIVRKRLEATTKKEKIEQELVKLLDE